MYEFNHYKQTILKLNVFFCISYNWQLIDNFCERNFLFSFGFFMLDWLLEQINSEKYALLSTNIQNLLDFVQYWLLKAIHLSLLFIMTLETFCIANRLLLHGGMFFLRLRNRICLGLEVWTLFTLTFYLHWILFFQ